MIGLRVNRKSLGINFSARGEADVLVWAPDAKAVSIKLSTKEIPLAEEEHGYWSAITPDIQPGDQYYFDVDGKALADPASVFQPEGISGASEVVNLHAFQWTDHEWINHPLPEYIIYELHTGTFTASGTFEDIIEKLPYLQDLGITAIELMPVAQFSGTRNWGYDGVFPFAVQNSYGGPIALQKLVNACHEKGIAVVLDVVYNHIGPEGNVLTEYGPYLTDKYKTPWGEAINFDDAQCDAVRHYFIENALMWLRDFHIDALRLDAVHAIRDFSPKHFLRELKERVNELMQETNRVHYLIAECDLNDRKYIDSLQTQGYGMNAQWIDEFHHALRTTTGQLKTGYYEDFNGILHLAKAWRAGYVYTGQYSPHRKRAFGTDTDGIAPDKFVVFSQNHDQVGNRMLGERTSQLVSFELLKVMAATVIMSPYLPMLFMGEEYGETNPFQYFVNHSGKELVQAVREGRKNEFRAFHDEGEVPDPQSQETFNRSKLQWNLTDSKHASLLKYYKELIALRKKFSAVSRTTDNNVVLEVFESQNVMLAERSQGNQRMLCVFNYSNRPQEIQSKLFNDAWKLELNSGVHDLKPSSSGAVTLPPELFLFFTHV